MGNEATKSIPSVDLRKIRNYNTDIDFIVNNQTVSAHRLVLIAASPVFSAMFRSDFIESRSQTIYLNDTDYVAFDHFIDTFYGTDLDYNNLLLVMDVIYLYKYYQVDFPQQQIMEDLADRVSRLDDEDDNVDIRIKFVDLVISVYENNNIPGCLHSTVRLGVEEMIRAENFDYGSLPDEIIKIYFDSANSQYKPSSEMETFDIIDRLVKSGRSESLYSMVAYDSLSRRDFQSIPSDIISRYNTGLHRESCDKMITSNEELFERNSILVRIVTMTIVWKPTPTAIPGHYNCYIYRYDSMACVIFDPDTPSLPAGKRILITEFKSREGIYEPYYVVIRAKKWRIIE